jgi:hypothetical protein
MNTLKRMLVQLDRRDTPPTPVQHAVALAKTLGAKLHVLPVSHDCEGDAATEGVHGMDPSPADAGSPFHAETGVPAGEKRRTMLRPCTLDAFTEELADSEGVRLLDLEPLTTLVVHTSHSVYRMTVLQDTTVLLRGGAFPVATMARLHGSGFGGHLLRLGWIGVGLRMEFSVDGKRFITSAVREITTECDAATHQPQ